MKKLIIFILFSSIIFACKKETTVIVPPIEPASCILKESNFKKDTTVQVWSVVDTSKGRASAIKVWKDWRAKVYAQYLGNEFAISFCTFYYTFGDVGKKEVFTFEDVPTKVGCYELKKNKTSFPNVQSTYSVVDDDVIECKYILDEGRSKNFLEITKFDSINQVIEGKFMATFLRDKSYPEFWYLQDTVRFANGSFWAKIQ